MAWTYMVRCRDGSLYTGWTTDVTRRVATHNTGRGAKYTRARLPVVLVYAHEHADKSTAMRDEVRIKRLTKTAKLQLIAAYDGVSDN